MALQVAEVARKFKFTPKGGKEQVLDDPNPNFTPEEVLAFHTNMFPELTTATVSLAKSSNEGITYEFKTTVGTKG